MDKQKIAYGLSIGTEIDDFQRPWRALWPLLRYFAAFGIFRDQLRQSSWRQTRTVCNKNVFKRIYYSAIYDLLMIFSDITEKYSVEERYHPLDSENSNCARLHGHLSNSWALVFYCSRPHNCKWEGIVHMHNYTLGFWGYWMSLKKRSNSKLRKFSPPLRRLCFIEHSPVSLSLCLFVCLCV